MRWGPDGTVRRGVGLSGLVLVLCLGGAMVGATSAHAAIAPAAGRAAADGGGTSAVSGTLVVPGPAAPAGGVTVTLTGVPTSGDAITRTAVSRADGTFTFRDLAGGDWIYTITAPYQGTTFSTDALTVPAGQGTTVKLPLFASTQSAAQVRTATWTVWLDVTGDRIAVQQDVAFTNLGSAAYTGTIPVSGTSPAARAAVQLPVAAGAEQFQYLGRFEVCCSATTDGGWAHTRPINPGGSSGTLRYEAPAVSSLTFRAQFPTDTFTMLVPEGTTVSSAQLSNEGTSTDRGTTYKVYRATALKAGDTVAVALTTPVAATSGGSTPWWVLALVLLAVAAVGVGAWMVLRRRRTPSAAPIAAPAPPTSRTTTAAGSGSKARRQTRKPKAANGSRATVATSAPASGPVASTATSRSRAEVLAEELAELDVKFENGELSDEAAYRRVREALVQRLVETVEHDPTALVLDDGGTRAPH